MRNFGLKQILVLIFIFLFLFGDFSVMKKKLNEFYIKIVGFLKKNRKKGT